MSNLTALGAAPDLTISLPHTEQSVVVFPGDGTVALLDDTLAPAALPELFSTAVIRAVTAARFRAWADLLERVDR